MVEMFDTSHPKKTKAEGENPASVQDKWSRFATHWKEGSHQA